MDSAEMLLGPLEDLPPFEFAFAYGSGVFEQPGNLHLSRNEAPMVDYILGVRTPILWHSENLERNPEHYSSCLTYFGGKGVSFIADKIGAGVHFNAFVPWKGKMIKYGVISMDYLIHDILSWNSLYISGRLQKPVKILVDDWDIAKVNQVNLLAAASAALLLLPAEFSKEELYMKICGLSYTGDVRMLFAEDKRKVRRIVEGNIGRFHCLYRNPLYQIAALGLLQLPAPHESLLRKDCSQNATNLLVSSLPDTILHKVAPTRMNNVFVEDPAKTLQRAIRSTVRMSSMRQVMQYFMFLLRLLQNNPSCKAIAVFSRKNWNQRIPFPGILYYEVLSIF